VSRRAVRPMADHAAAAAALREAPGVERLVAMYRAGSLSAYSTARAVRIGQSGYAPAGAFEARLVPVGDETGLYVRFVGADADVSA